MRNFVPYMVAAGALALFLLLGVAAPIDTADPTRSEIVTLQRGLAIYGTLGLFALWRISERK